MTDGFKNAYAECESFLFQAADILDMAYTEDDLKGRKGYGKEFSLDKEAEKILAGYPKREDMTPSAAWACYNAVANFVNSSPLNEDYGLRLRPVFSRDTQTCDMTLILEFGEHGRINNENARFDLADKEDDRNFLTFFEEKVITPALMDATGKAKTVDFENVAKEDMRAFLRDGEIQGTLKSELSRNKLIERE